MVILAVAGDVLAATCWAAFYITAGDVGKLAGSSTDLVTKPFTVNGLDDRIKMALAHRVHPPIINAIQSTKRDLVERLDAIIETHSPVEGTPQVPDNSTEEREAVK